MPLKTGPRDCDANEEILFSGRYVDEYMTNSVSIFLYKRVY